MTGDHAAMVRRWMWREFASIALGVWLTASPATLRYGDTWAAVSDVASGALIVAVGVLTLVPRFDLARCAPAIDRRQTPPR